MFDDLAIIFPYCLILTAIANYIFYFFYIFSSPSRSLRRFYSQIEKIEGRRPDYYIAGLFLFALGFVVFMYMAEVNGGILNFALLGYGVTGYFSDHPLLAISIPVMYVSSFFLFYAYIDRRRRSALILSLLIIILLSFIEIMLGRRAELAVWSLAYLINFSILKKHINFIFIMPLAIGGFVFLNFLGIIRQSNYTDLSAFVDHALIVQESSEGYYSYVYTLTEGQFVVPYETLPVLMNYLERDGYWYGMSALGNLALWVPRVLWPDKGHGLSSWYFTTFYDPAASPNEGRQFFFLSEGYLNFGVIGVLIWAALWGWLWKAITTCLFTRSDRLGHGRRGISIIGSFVFSIYTANMVKLVASDSAGILVALVKDSVLWLVVGVSLGLFISKVRAVLPSKLTGHAVN